MYSKQNELNGVPISTL